LEEYKIRELLTKYNKFMPIAIKLELKQKRYQNQKMLQKIT